jgi:hypothetical protein
MELLNCPAIELLKPSIEELVRSIVAVNHAWKEARNLFGQDSHTGNRLRDLKSSLQVRLLKRYAPHKVYLVEHYDPDTQEPLYGLQLVEPLGTWDDAAHIPVRVLQERVSPADIRRFQGL